jgi:hypothetical protein
MPDVLDGTVEPGRVFDRTIGLDQVLTATVPWPNATRSRCWSSPDTSTTFNYTTKDKG